MWKRVASIIVFILLLAMTGCSGTQAVETAASGPFDVQSACEQAVLDFTEGSPFEFIEKVDESDTELSDMYLGDYVFEDNIYQYIVNPDVPYICRINRKAGAAWDEYEDSRTGVQTKEDAEDMALDIFNRIMPKLLVQGGEVNADCTSPDDSEGYYTVEVQEWLSGVPTGNKAGITVSRKGIMVGGVFLKGDPKNIDKIKSGKDGMISAEAAGQIALEEARGMEELEAAQNIRLDEDKPYELMTIGDTTVWAVRFKFNRNTDMPGNEFGGMVMVDAFCGEVFRTYLSA